MLSRTTFIAILGLLAGGVCAAAEAPAALYPVKFFDFIAETQPVRLAYRDVPATGKANGATVLLLHGEDFSGTYWENTAQTLAADGFRVVVPDQLGFGASSRPNIHYSFHQMAENMQRLLSYLDVREVEVVGHSMGGMLAVRFTLMYPGMVRKLVLEDPIGLEDYRTFLPYVPLENMVHIDLHATHDTFLDRHKTFYVTWKPEYEAYAQEEARVVDTGDFPEAALCWAITYEMVYQQPVVYELPEIQIPTLLIVGAQDQPIVGAVINLYPRPSDMPGMNMGSMMPQDDKILRTAGRMPDAYAKQFGPYRAVVEKAHEAIKNSTLVVIPNTAHIPHLETPEKFYQAVVPFLQP